MAILDEAFFFRGSFKESKHTVLKLYLKGIYSNFIEILNTKEYLLSWQRSAASISLSFTSDQSFGDKDQFTAIVSVPYHGDVMPLAVVDRRVLPEWQINVLQIVEEGNLDTVTVRLDHESAIRWDMGRAENKSYIRTLERYAWRILTGIFDE